MSYVGNSTIGTGSGLTITVPSYTYTAGSGILIGFRLINNRTISGLSGGSNTYTQLVRILAASSPANHVLEWWYSPNVSGGTYTITATISGAGTPSWWGVSIEDNAIDTSSPADAFSSLDSLAQATPVYCAPSGSIDTAGSAGLCGCSISATLNRDWSAASGFTRISSGSTGFAFAYQAFSSALVDERGGFSWGTGGTPDIIGAIAAIKAPSGGGGSSNAGQLLLLGCGA